MIADLGLCQETGPDSFVNTICGSLDYMAPEVIIGSPYDGKAADIWTMGVLLFSMLFDQLPWAETNHIGLITQI
jgi:protein-serine/threonine kinase